MTDTERIRVFDPTAIVLLFAAHPRATDEYDRYPVAFPAAAIAEANTLTQASENDWEAILLGDDVTVLDLTASAAVTASLTGPTSGVGHTICESWRLRGIVVTGRAVNVYDRLNVPVVKL